MCGIAGFAGNWTPRGDGPVARRPEDIVRDMCSVMRHRGPDDEGFYVDSSAALGMRRLSIIDLSTGHQPMHNEDRSVWVVFNGEIYNYQPLRDELEQAGHRFYTSSDTETIVHAYEQWGAASIGRLRGMFGIALWDARERRLLLARDRAGIKPLYYTEQPGALLFGSEAKCLLAAGIERHLNLQALDHYLSFLYTPRDDSIFRGINKLPPGHLLEWHDGRVRLHQYWEIAATESFDGTEGEAADELRRVLADAVRSHLISDVPLGAFLSGGLDSSVVVGLMAEASSRPVRTFSIGFDEPKYDELEHARLVARHFGTDHHEDVVRPNALEVLDRVIDHFDEPFGDSSAIPTWYVSQIARRHVTVVLSGDGGDELFGGYTRYHPHPRVARFDQLPIPGRRRMAAAVWPLLPHGARGKNFLRHVAQRWQDRYLEEVGLFRADEREALLAPDARRAIDVSPEDGMRERMRRFAALPPQSQMMRLDFETYLPQDCLTKVDRMTMAHSIESRVPLLDNHVIDFVASLPLSMKIRNGRGKQILRRVAETLVPRQILERRKQGFGVPVGVWFRGQLRGFCSDVLLSPRTRQRGLFDSRFVARLLDEHVSGRRDHELRLWQLVVFELWHRQYLDEVASVNRDTHERRWGSVQTMPLPA